MLEGFPAIADIRLIALDGERSHETLPAVRDVAIRVKVNVLEPDNGDLSQLEGQPVTILATLFLEVFGAGDGDDDGTSSQTEAGVRGAEDVDSRSPVYSGRVTFRIDAERPSKEDPHWVPAIVAEAWPYLRSQVVAHALLLGMGRIPVPLEAPENLARQPQRGEE